MTEYKDFGWANGWSEEPEIVKKCKDAGHRRTITDIGRSPMRGLDNLVRCDICRYEYHYDSSD